MTNLPSDLPPDFFSALESLNAKSRLELDDLKLLVLLECAGEPLYAAVAALHPNPDAVELLSKNAREERAHAYRMKKAIEILTGAPFEIPSLDQNPYGIPPEFSELSPELFDAFESAEYNGDAQYHVWADNEPNNDVAALLRQNGIEETRHGQRVAEAKALLGT